jgi:hypothetical protein
MRSTVQGACGVVGNPAESMKVGMFRGFPSGHGLLCGQISVAMGVLCCGKCGTPWLSGDNIGLSVTWFGRDGKSRGLERAWRGKRC